MRETRFTASIITKNGYVFNFFYYFGIMHNKMRYIPYKTNKYSSSQFGTQGDLLRYIL